MRAFVAMRKYINTNLIEQRYINNLLNKLKGVNNEWYNSKRWY